MFVGCSIPIVPNAVAHSVEKRPMAILYIPIVCCERAAAASSGEGKDEGKGVPSRATLRRARKVVVNSFGILSSPHCVSMVVYAIDRAIAKSVCLHWSKYANVSSGAPQ